MQKHFSAKKSYRFDTIANCIYTTKGLSVYNYLATNKTESVYCRIATVGIHSLSTVRGVNKKYTKSTLLI